jgi:hypothetical protein
VSLVLIDSFMTFVVEKCDKALDKHTAESYSYKSVRHVSWLTYIYLVECALMLTMNSSVLTSEVTLISELGE